MFTLYGMDLSNNVSKVKFAANIMNLKYDFKQVNLMAGENKTPEFLAINPVGRIPAIREGDFTLFESNAIIKYLADSNNSPLYPRDPKKRALIDQWIDFSSIHVQAALNRIFFNRIIYKMMNVPKDENSLAEGIKFVAQFLPIIDKQLAQSRYLAGNELTLADIDLLAILEPCEAVSVDLSAYSKIVAWRKGLQQNAWYQTVRKDADAAMQKVMAQLANAGAGAGAR